MAQSNIPTRILPLKGQRQPAPRFSGFADKDYPRVLHQIIDQIGPGLTGREFRVMITLCRWTLGNGVQHVRMNAETIAQLSGLSIPSVRRSAWSLEARGLIERSDGGNSVDRTHGYSLAFIEGVR